jgi:hypothetical protein
MGAAQSVQEAAVDYLLSIHVDLNKQTSVGSWYVLYVCQISQGGNVYTACTCEQDGWTALHDACNYGRTAMAKKLILAGADTNLRNDVRTRPGHALMFYHHMSPCVAATYSSILRSLVTGKYDGIGENENAVGQRAITGTLCH